MLRLANPVLAAGRTRPAPPAILLVVLVATAACFAIFCLADLTRAEEVRYLPKPLWAVVILISIPLGGIVYLAVGRVPKGAHHPVSTRSIPLPANGGGSSAAPVRFPRARSGPIEIDHLSKRFGRVTAVDDLSFEVRPGRVTGFLGPNGAGKTTTMRLLLGLETPTAGRASVNGRPYRSLARPLHQVGSLLDADSAHPGRSAWEHIVAVAQSNGIGKARVLQVLDQTGVAHVAHRRVREFSLGMKQRLGIAIALLGDPPVLLFDEPVNGLDPEGVRWVRELFQSLAAEGRTVFVSSHLMSEMALTADHLVIIGRGRLLADSSTSDFVEANARHDVFVRSPQAGQLMELLVAAGAGVTAEAGGGLSVTGLDAPAIADLAAARRLAIHELTPRRASLEDAYLHLTRGSVEYPAGAPTHPAAEAVP